MAEGVSGSKDFLEEVEESNFQRVLCPSKTLVYNLMMCKRGTHEHKSQALLGQARLAREARAGEWLKVVAKEAWTLEFQSHDWICANISILGKRQKAKPCSQELPTASTDFRKKLDPTISSIVEDQGRLAVEARSASATVTRQEEAGSSLSSGAEEDLLRMVDDVGCPDAGKSVPSTVQAAVEPMEVDRPTPIEPEGQDSLVKEPLPGEQSVERVSTFRYPSPVKKRHVQPRPREEPVSGREEQFQTHSQRRRTRRRHRSKLEAPMLQPRGRGMTVDLPQEGYASSRQSRSLDEIAVPPRQARGRGAVPKTSTYSGHSHRGPKSSVERGEKRGRTSSLEGGSYRGPKSSVVSSQSREGRKGGKAAAPPRDRSGRDVDRSATETAGGKLQITVPADKYRSPGGRPRGSNPRFRSPVDRVEQQQGQIVKGQRRLERGQPCLVPECDKSNAYPRAHAFQHHIPNLFEEGRDLEEVTRKRVAALKLMAGWLLGNRAKLEDLAVYVNSTEQITPESNREVTTGQSEEMVDVSRELMQNPPGRFTIAPLNSLASLIHWRALMVVIAKLEPRHRQSLMDQFHDLEPSVREVSQAEIPEGFDSHFHLDRLQGVMRMPGAKLPEIHEVIGTPSPSWQVKLVGAVANFCDPATYPSEELVRTLHQEGLYVTIGLHPKDVNDVTDEVMRRMETLLDMPEVVGLGEVGIDHSVPPRFWGNQQRVLSRALPLLKNRHVLVVHCRGMELSGQVSEAYTTLLYHLQPRVPRDQCIHLHCFTGTEDMVREWSSVFPNTYFGYTRLVDRFDDTQLGGLRAVREDRILLETDAPYFQFSKAQVDDQTIRHTSKYSAPNLIGLTAAVVAMRRGVEVRDLLQRTVANANVLYGGRSAGMEVQVSEEHEPSQE